MRRHGLFYYIIKLTRQTCFRQIAIQSKYIGNSFSSPSDPSNQTAMRRTQKIQLAETPNGDRARCVSSVATCSTLNQFH